MPKAVSLFTGCGGSDAGLVAAGFDVVMANDIISYARDVYLANLPETDYRVGDVAEIESFPSAELLVGCYPCQGFSQGGARESGRSINYLYREFARALRQIRPKAFIVENVSGLIRENNADIFADQLTQFRRAGYRVTYAALGAQDFGVPQERKRVIIVGLRTDLGLEYEFPAATHGPLGFEPHVTIKQAIGDLPRWPVGEFYDEGFHWYYLSRDRRRGWLDVSKTIVSNWRHVPLHPMSPQLVKVGPDAWQFKTNGRARRFSFREAARLQALDRTYTVHGEDFIFPHVPARSGSVLQNQMKQKYRVVGNAVPPPLFEAVARALPAIWD